MKPIIEERNVTIREQYRKLMKFQKHSSAEAIEALVKKHNVWNLTYDTVRAIVTNQNYGTKKKKDAGNETNSIQEITEKGEGV